MISPSQVPKRPRDQATSSLNDDESMRNLKQPNVAGSPECRWPNGSLRVCELFAGLATMAAAFQRLGWQVSHVIERASDLREYLLQEFPTATVTEDVEHKPWQAWRQQGQSVDLVAAGFPCQPFSEAGQLALDRDPRAGHVLLVCEAAVALCAMYVLLENVPNFVDLDTTHHLFSRVCDYMVGQGYHLVQVIRLAHDSCGGATRRMRVFILFASAGAPPVLPFVECDMGTTVSRDRRMLSGERAVNWKLLGTLSACGRFLRMWGPQLVPGVVVTVQDESPEVLWRVQSVHGSRVVIWRVDRSPGERKLSLGRLRIERVNASCYRVYSREETKGTVKAFGEPPGRGAPLLGLDGGVFTASTNDRLALMGYTEANGLALARAGVTQQAVATAVGNSVPVEMASAIAQWLDGQVRVTVMPHAEARPEAPASPEEQCPTAGPAPAIAGAPPRAPPAVEPARSAAVAQPDAAAEPEAYCATAAPDPAIPGAPTHAPPAMEPARSAAAARTEGISEPEDWCATAAPVPAIPGAPTHTPQAVEPALLAAVPDSGSWTTLLVIPVSQARGVIFLSATLQPLTQHYRQGELTIRTVTKLAQRTVPGLVTFFAGKCWYGPAHVWVAVALVPLEWHTEMQGVELDQTVGTPAYESCSLALAKVGSMVSGYTTPQLLLPLLDSSGRVQVGKVAAKHVQPNKVAKEAARVTREEALRLCEHAAELMRSAFEAAAGEAGTECERSYMEEWRDQVGTTTLGELPDELLAQIPACTDPQLAVLAFSDTLRLPKTEAFDPPAEQTPPVGFEPSGLADLVHTNTLQELEAWESEMLPYFRQLYTGEASEQELIHCRPHPRFFSQVDTQEQAKGRVWDLRHHWATGEPPTPAVFGTPVQSHINTAAWLEVLERVYPDGCPDQQLVTHVTRGVCTLSDRDLQSSMAPPLISLGAGMHSLSSELTRMVESGYLQCHRRLPFWPCCINPMGSRAKNSVDGEGNPIYRRISEMGFPRGYAVDSDGMQVFSSNTQTALHLPLPKEVKPTHANVALDMAIQRYIGQLIGWTLVSLSDDLKDWFHQLIQHLSELWKSCFMFYDPEEDCLLYFVELVMGLGFIHTSNIAQRFGITIVHMWWLEFKVLDDAFMEAAAKRHPILRAWLEHREKMEQRGVLPEARLEAAHIYTDDMHMLLLEPPHGEGSRLLLAIQAWYKVTTLLGIRTASPEKRLAGACVPWIGLAFVSCLGLLVVPAEKTHRALVQLVQAAAGALTVEDYQKLVGLLGFIRFALGLPKWQLAIAFEPMRKGGEAQQGLQTVVKATPRRCKTWRHWALQMLNAHGAPCTMALPSAAEQELQRARRVFVWYGDAAVKGTKSPALAGYAHGSYWVFRLHRRHTKALHIGALEFLVLLGNLMILGNVLPDASEGQLAVLLQSDSLVSVYDLADQAAKSPIMIHIHEAIRNRPEFQRLAPRLVLGHVWGEGNPLADNLSRGSLDIFVRTCRVLGVKPTKLHIPQAFVRLVEAAVEFAEHEQG